MVKNASYHRLLTYKPTLSYFITAKRVWCAPFWSLGTSKCSIFGPDCYFRHRSMDQTVLYGRFFNRKRGLDCTLYTRKKIYSPNIRAQIMKTKIGKFLKNPL